MLRETERKKRLGEHQIIFHGDTCSYIRGRSKKTCTQIIYALLSCVFGKPTFLRRKFNEMKGFKSMKTNSQFNLINYTHVNL